MGLVDLTFRALGPEVLAIVWPAFLAFAVGQIAFVANVRRQGPPDLVWSVAALMAALMTFAALGIASERAWAQFIAREGLQPSSQTVWERLLNVIRWSTGPTLWIFAIGQVLLAIRPRSHLLAATLTAVSGTALSWAIAIWLFLQPPTEILLPLFRLPLTLGIVASALGFAASGALWTSTTRLGSRG